MRRLASRRFPLLMLLAAALFARAFLPAGTMPERSDGGTLVVRLCASGMLMAIPLGREAPAENERRAEPPCVFAGLSTPVVPTPGALALPVTGRAERQPIERVAGDARGAPARLRPPARGPPLAV